MNRNATDHPARDGLSISGSECAGMMLSPWLAAQAPLLQRYAASAAPVFVSGESGTGKTYVARLVHALSRSDAPCVLVSASSIPDDLVEIELFGHAAGAFTDGGAAKLGKLALAAGGTFILDGADEASRVMQSRLSAALRSGFYYPLGGTNPEPISCRFVVTAQRAADDLVESGMFARELAYLLNVLPFRTLPLSLRPEDIPFFRQWFLEGPGRGAWPVRAHQPGLDAALLARPWPGNITELAGALERARTTTPEDEPVGMTHFMDAADQKKLKEALNRYKKNFVHAILRECNDNQTEAARVLGIQRTYLSRLIKELDIPH